VIPFKSAPVIKIVISGTTIGFHIFLKILRKNGTPLEFIIIEKIKTIANIITRNKFTNKTLSII
tara:strand:- start:1630 stop:1821 length:192 start_codon:yes stop_codon:yes gene_type:complete